MAIKKLANYLANWLKTYLKVPGYVFTVLFVIWMIVAFAWMYDARVQCVPNIPTGECVPLYTPYYNEIVSYQEILETHPYYHPNNRPIFIPFLIALVGGAALLLLSKQRQWAVLVMFFIPFTCYVSVDGIFEDHTSLRHAETVKFANQIYHLVHSDETHGGGDVPVQALYLFECELDADTCRGRTIAGGWWGEYDVFENPRLQVDKATNQLHVIANDTIYFSLPNGLIPPPSP